MKVTRQEKKEYLVEALMCLNLCFRSDRVTLLADNCHLEGILGCRHFVGIASGDVRCLRQYHSLP